VRMALDNRNLALEAAERLVIRTVEFGNATACPGCRRRGQEAPTTPAMPLSQRGTSGRMNCIVSKMAMPAATTRPGKLNVKLISLFRIFRSRNASGHDQFAVVLTGPTELSVPSSSAINVVRALVRVRSVDHHCNESSRRFCMVGLVVSLLRVQL